MKYIAFFLILLVVYVSSDFNLRGPGNATLQRRHFLPVLNGVEKNEISSYPRIINGAYAEPDEFPYMVGLECVHNVGSKLCGGALIAHEWVLTAAHCIIAVNFVKVFLGMHFLGHSVLEYWVPSNHIVHHEHNVDGIYTADIALIQIPHVDYTESIRKIPLPKTVEPLPHYAGHGAITMGWGQTSSFGNALAHTLQYITLTVIKNSECERAYGPQQIHPGKICTSGHLHDGPCYGDSGGPLVSRITGTLIGIYSFGSQHGCTTGAPEAFTRVDQYVSWIRSKIGTAD